MQTPYIYALGANFCFALATIFFTHYTRKVSSIWVNSFKATVAFIFFFLTINLTTGFHEISILNIGIFFISGFIALGIGDIFLLKAFSLIGPGRTMVLFGFHPVVVGVISYFAFGQKISSAKFLVIFLFILCLVTFSYESFLKHKKWDFKGLSFALIGMGLDAIGVTITRIGFDMNESITGFEGNFYRCFGAICAYILLSKKMNLQFFTHLKALPKKSLLFIFIGSVLGTFLSLALYLEAIKTAHLATVSAIAITGVLFSSIFECIWEKKLPSKFLLISFIFFGIGMWVLFEN